MLLDELFHHDIIRGALNRHAGVSNAGANAGGDDVTDEVLSVARAGYSAAQVVRIISGSDDRRIPDASVFLHLEPAGRCSGGEIPRIIERYCADGSEMSLRARGRARFPAILFRLFDFVRFPASLGPEVIRRDELHSL